jgi:hypothetical protein
MDEILERIKEEEVERPHTIQDRIEENLEDCINLVSFFRQYPDIFVDFIKGPDSTFKFMFYQRIFLRIVMRHRYVYATFPRKRISAGWE